MSAITIIIWYGWGFIQSYFTVEKYKEVSVTLDAEH